jgi:hypothetical protein
MLSFLDFQFNVAGFSRCYSDVNTNVFGKTIPDGNAPVIADILPVYGEGAEIFLALLKQVIVRTGKTALVGFYIDSFKELIRAGGSFKHSVKGCIRPVLIHPHFDPFNDGTHGGDIVLDPFFLDLVIHAELNTPQVPFCYNLVKLVRVGGSTIVGLIIGFNGIIDVIPIDKGVILHLVQEI